MREYLEHHFKRGSDRRTDRTCRGIIEAYVG
nr:MAG TPA: hypothetical protein [Caudoviricetes sp.]